MLTLPEDNAPKKDPRKFDAEEVIKRLSPSAALALRHFAGSPSDCAAFHARLSIMRAGIRIGAEMMEKTGNVEAMLGAAHALANVCAIEMTMSVLENMHPGQMGTQNESRPGQGPKMPTPFGSTQERARRLELD